MTLTYNSVSDIIVVCFDSGEYKYYMSSPPETEIQTLYDYLVSELCTSPVMSLGSSDLDLSPDASRTIWEYLVKKGYERINDLEAIANYKYRDDDITAYKIRDKKTKMYSMGGQSGGRWMWTKKGKTWNQLNHIQSHMTQLSGSTNSKGIPEDYENSELVELGEVKSTDMTDFQKLKKAKK